METIFGIQKFILINEEEKPSGRAKIFFGNNAEKIANEYIEEYCEINDYVEIMNSCFNERLFRNENNYVELFKLESEHFVHNCD